MVPWDLHSARSRYVYMVRERRVVVARKRCVRMRKLRFAVSNRVGTLSMTRPNSRKLMKK